MRPKSILRHNKIILFTVLGIFCLGVFLLLWQKQAWAPSVLDSNSPETPLSLPISQPLSTTQNSLSATFIIYGDTRNGDAKHRQLVSLMQEYQFDAVIHLGDIAYRGTDTEAWQTFWDITAPLRTEAPYWVIEGNHENPQDQFPQYFEDELGNHVHTLSGTTFLFLDLEQGIAPASEYIRQNATAQTIVLTHYPIFTGGPHASDSLVKQAGSLHDVFREKHIVLVFSGHDHNYQRIERDGITYVVSGGGGAPLYSIGQIDGMASSAKAYHFVVLEISGELWSMKTVNIDGEEIDNVKGNFSAR